MTFPFVAFPWMFLLVCNHFILVLFLLQASTTVKLEELIRCDMSDCQNSPLKMVILLTLINLICNQEFSLSDAELSILQEEG